MAMCVCAHIYVYMYRNLFIYIYIYMHMHTYMGVLIERGRKREKERERDGQRHGTVGTVRHLRMDLLMCSYEIHWKVQAVHSCLFLVFGPLRFRVFWIASTPSCKLGGLHGILVC